VTFCPMWGTSCCCASPLLRPRESPAVRLKDPDRFDGYRLSNAVLLAEAPPFAARERSATADLLVRMAQIDLRQLYRNAGFTSMAAYSMCALRLSEDEAWKRIQASRAALRFPILFEALAESRLHLTAICLLSPYLNSDNVEELVTAATQRSKAAIQRLLAERFPAPETLAIIPEVSRIPAPSPAASRVALDHLSPVPEQVDRQGDQAAGSAPTSPVPEQVAPPPRPAGPVVQSPVPEQVARPASGQPSRHLTAFRPVPIGHRKFRVEFTIDEQEHELLEHAQALLSHRYPSAGAGQVFVMALKTLVRTLEKRKFAATAHPRAPRDRSARSRAIPAHVRRAIRKRDGDQCTFVSDTGQRCAARRFLEYDHIQPVARGGKPKLEKMRLLCRSHNQYEAERMFGAGFMTMKREQAQRMRAEERNARHSKAKSDLESGEEPQGHEPKGEGRKEKREGRKEEST